MIKNCIPPNRSVYQVIRYVDGAAVAITATRKGVISLFEERCTQVSADVVGQGWVRAKDADHRAMLIERAVNAGYNIVEIANRLRDEAARRR